MSGLGLLSHAIASIAFAVLAALAFASDRRIRQGKALALAAVISALWASLLTVLESGRDIPRWLLLGADVARYGAWLWFLLLLAPPTLPRVVRFAVPALLIIWILLGMVMPLLDQVLIRGGLVASLIGLITLEQIYRNALPEGRRNLHFLMLGVGGVFAFDLFLYSQAELFHGFDADSWHARGLVNALMVPFLVIGARRLPEVRLELYVSRDVTFYTTTLVGVGVYVLVTASVGYVIRSIGGEWGEVIRLAFLAGAFVLLVALVASGTLRRQIRVFLSKNFYRTKYDYRAEWLRFVRTISAASGSNVPAAAVRSVAQILDSPGGLLFRQPDGSGAFVPIGNWPALLDEATESLGIPAASTLVAFMRTRRWIVDLRERELQPDLYDNLEVPHWLEQDRRWRLVSPIFLGDSLLGFFLLQEPPGPFRLMYEDRDLLNTAGQHVGTLLAQQDADKRVTELSQFEAYNRLTIFVMHDLKNCAAQLSLLVGNAVRHKRNPEFIDDAISTIAQTAERMTRLIEQLRYQSAPLASRLVRVHEALQMAIARCAPRKPRPVFEPVSGRSWQVLADPERMIAAFEHVIRNAQDASGEAGKVSVIVEERETILRISVIDTGPGMDAEFIRLRLFRPFDTTKGPTGMGVGAYQAREFARSIGGDVEVWSAPDQGTRFSFEFPLSHVGQEGS